MCVCVCELVDSVHGAILPAGTSRCDAHKDINPTMAVHDVYRARQAVNDLHSLVHKVQGFGTLAGDRERLCTCGSAQMERRASENCPETRQMRDQYSFTSSEESFSNLCNEIVCKIIQDILWLYDYFFCLVLLISCVGVLFWG